MNAFASWKNVMLKWNRSVIGVNDVTRLLMQMTDPFGKLTSVGYRGGQKHKVDIVWQ